MKRFFGSLKSLIKYNLVLTKKQIIRQQVKNKISNLSQRQKKQLSKNLLNNCQNFFNKFPLMKTSIIAGFYPLSYEINIIPTMQYLQSLGYQVCLPVMFKEELRFRLCDFFQNKNLVLSSKLPILQPKSGKYVIPNIILAPMLSFDTQGNRLGQGKGYYDKTLAKFSKNNNNNKITYIGISYDIQKYDTTLPSESTDIPLNSAITDKKYYIFKRGNLC